MLVAPPFGEAGEIGDNLVGVGVKDVRPVAVDEDARRVVAVIGVSRDMRPPVAHEHPFARTRRQPLGEHRSGEARPGHDDVVGRSRPPAHRQAGEIRPAPAVPSE